MVENKNMETNDEMMKIINGGMTDREPLHEVGDLVKPKNYPEERESYEIMADTFLGYFVSCNRNFF